MLREWDFELVNAPDTYVDDYTQMIVQPLSPCPVRFSRRLREAPSVAAGVVSAEASSESTAVGAAQAPTRYRAVIDLQLCQGHAMCVGEAPEIFTLHGDHAEVAEGGFDAGLLDRARRAEEHCPNQAIQLQPVA